MFQTTLPLVEEQIIPTLEPTIPIPLKIGQRLPLPEEMTLKLKTILPILFLEQEPTQILIAVLEAKVTLLQGHTHRVLIVPMMEVEEHLVATEEDN